jgi:uncharacterized delta-60 repeat protein
MSNRHFPSLFMPLCAAVLLIVAPCMQPASARQVDAGFAPNPDDTVHAIAVQADGRIVIGGLFRHVDGSIRNRLARLNADGSLDADFDPGAGGLLRDVIYSVLVQPDGKILFGGNYFGLGTGRAEGVLRLNPDGSKDDSFVGSIHCANDDDGVYAMVLQPDGKVLVGGKLSAMFETPFGSQPEPMGVVRLNPDGSRDESWRPELTTDTFIDGDIFALALQADGKLVVTGNFTSIDKQPRMHIARLNADGSLDAGFIVDMGNGWVTDLAVQADGRILLGGMFVYVNGVRRNNLARLNPDGSIDTGFDPFPDLDVHGLALQANGKILVGGSFTHIGGKVRNHIARLNADGSLDAGFDYDANGRVGHMAVQPDSRILVTSGDWLAPGIAGFTMINGLPRNGIARLDAGDDGIFSNGFE